MCSIELECINVALQKDLEQAWKLAREVPLLKEKIEEISQNNLSQITEMANNHKAAMKAKKQKYIRKIKDLEGKFITMCEDKMKAIQGKF